MSGSVAGGSVVGGSVAGGPVVDGPVASGPAMSGPGAAGLVSVFAALADETRWSILTALGAADASASSLAERMPVSRQAIAKHLGLLQDAGLVERVRVGRELKYRALGSQLGATARRLDAIGAAWDRRLAAIKEIAEGL